MNSTKFFNIVNKNMALLQAALFLTALWLPTLDSFFDLDKAPWLNEKRTPATFPEIAPNSKSLLALPAGLEAYYNDHFGFRRRLIRWEQHWKQDVFKESSRPDVMVGRDGWLFFTATRMIEHYRGVDTFTPDELQSWRSLLEKRRDWLNQRGIKYLFVITPDKHSIYPEYLPTWMPKKGPETKLDQFLAYMKAHSTVDVLDLRPALLEAKKTARTYLYTDTHWNSYGGFIGYQSVMRSLTRQLPELGGPLLFEAFELTPFQETGGDLSTMLGQETAEREGSQLTARPPLHFPVAKEDINIYNKQWYNNSVPVYTENPSGKFKLLMFRDSFSCAWVPYLGYHFKRAVYIWQYNWNIPVIEKEKPDVVVDEFLERLFNVADTKKLMKDDGLP
jgi:alginate O-acetyltransferase complex protein AlgJ